MNKYILFVLISLFFMVNITSAADYYVATTGDDDDPGTIGEPWATITYAAAHATTPGDVINIKTGDYGHEHVICYSGSYNNPITFRGYGGIVEIEAGDRVGTGFEAIGNNHITIENITINRYYYGVQGCGDNLTVKNCSFTENGLAGISHCCCEGTNASFTDNSFYDYSPGGVDDGSQDYGIQTYYLDVVNISNNYIYGRGHHSISLKRDTTNAFISNNTCDGFYYDGIVVGQNPSIYMDACSDIIIENNTLGVAMEGSYEHRAHDGIRVMQANDVIIRDNFIKGSDYNGIYIDGNNEWTDPDTWHDPPFENVSIYRNTVIDGVRGIHFRGPYDNFTVYNNVILNNTDNILFPSGSLPANGIIKNNIIAYGVYGIRVVSGLSEPVLEYNDVYGNSDNYNGCTAGTESISVNPLFADYSGNDFHLKSVYGRWTGTTWTTDAVTSPCIDAGNPVDDYSNEPSENGECINMGLYGNTAEASKSSSSTSPVSYDNRIRETTPNQVLQTDIFMDVGSIGTNDYRFWFWYNLSDYNVTDIVKSVSWNPHWYYNTSARNKSTNVSIYVPNGTVTTDHVNWNNRTNGVAWINPGGDWLDADNTSQGNNPFVSVIFPDTSPSDSKHSFNSTAFTHLVQSWINGTVTNNGMFIMANETDTNYIAFYSLDSTTPAFRHSLDIVLEGDSSNIIGVGGADWYGNSILTNAIENPNIEHIELDLTENGYRNRWDGGVLDWNQTSSNNLTLYGDAIFNMSGLHLDGSGDYGECGIFNFSNDFTLISKINITDFSSRPGMIFGRDNVSDNRAFNFHHLSTTHKQLYSELFKTDSVCTIASGDTALAVDTDYHISMPYNYTSNASSIIDIFLNGAKDATQVTNAIGPIQSLNIPVMIGRRNSPTYPDYFNGTIKYGLIYSFLVSQSGINHTRDGHHKTSGNLTTWYECDTGNETYQIIINATTPTNTNYTVWYRQNATGNFAQVGGVRTGNDTVSLSPAYQNTDIRLVLIGNTSETPEIITIEFYESSESDSTPPASITDIFNTTGPDWHKWTWNNPLDLDFNHTMIYINSVWVANISIEEYNLSASSPNTSTISTHTVDTSGNINSTWVNHTSTMSYDPNTLFQFWYNSAWVEATTSNYPLWFDCYYITKYYPDGVYPNADQTDTQHSLNLTNNGTTGGYPKIRFNETPPSTIKIFIDDDHTVAGAVEITDSYQIVGPWLDVDESVELSAWTNLTGPTETWEFIVEADVQ